MAVIPALSYQQTYDSIYSQTLNVDTTSFTISNIPQNYTDLMIIASVKGTINGYGLMARFNNDSSTNYSVTYMMGNGTTCSGGRVTSVTKAYLQNYGVSDAVDYALAKSIIFQYTNTNMYKTVLSESAGIRTGNGLDRSVNVWRSTNAITSIYFELFSGTIKANSTFALYGIKAA